MFATPIAGLAIWYGVSFYPYVSQMEKMAGSANSSAQPVADTLYKYAVVAESEYGIRSYATTQAYWSLVFSKNRTSTLSWHANNLLWYLASHLHFNKKEIFGLWLSCSIERCGNGLSSAAVKYYGKELASLSVRELVGLVAMVKSPSAYKPGSERSEMRIEYILSKLQAHNKSLQPTHLRGTFFVLFSTKISTTPVVG